MSYLRRLSLKQLRSFQTMLFTLLKEILSPDILCCLQIGKPLFQLLGVEIKAFVLIAPRIPQLLTKRLQEKIEVGTLSKVLTLCYV